MYTLRYYCVRCDTGLYTIILQVYTFPMQNVYKNTNNVIMYLYNRGMHTSSKLLNAN